MSRRSRKRGQRGKGGRLGLIAVLLFVVLVVAIGVTHTWVRHYLQSDKFRLFLSDKVSQAIRVEGRFEPFRWDGLAVDTHGFQATGEQLIRELEVEDVHAEVGLDSLLEGVWKIEGARVRRMELLLDATKPSGMPVKPAVEVKPAGGGPRGWLPRKVELTGLDVGELAVKASTGQGEFDLSGMAARIRPTPGGQAHDVELAGGLIRLPWKQVPEIRLESASLRHQKDGVFLNRAVATAMENARLEVNGEWNAHDKSSVVQGTLGGVKCSEVLGEDWIKRLSGDLATDFQGVSRAEGVSASGHLVLRNGVLTALPVLDVLAAYADNRRFLVLTLSEAEVDWARTKEGWTFTNLILASEGLLRLEGDLALRGRELDGNFRLGLAPGTLSSIPGAESHVFKPGERGLMWAPLRITGTLDEPKQDLKNRLIRAAGARLFTILPDTGGKVLKFSGRVLKDSSTKVLEGGVKVIEAGGDVIKGAGGVLNQILGGRPREPQPDDEKNE